MQTQTIARYYPAAYINATQITPGVWAIIDHHQPAAVTLPPRAPVVSSRKPLPVQVH